MFIYSNDYKNIYVFFFVEDWKFKGQIWKKKPKTCLITLKFPLNNN